MPPALLLTPGAALVAGLVASLHCVGMCGPLACAILPARPSERPALASAYHLARISGYTVLGALAGGLGRLPLSWVPRPIIQWLPFIVVAFFIGLALGWDKHWVKSTVLTKAAFRTSQRLGRRSPMASAVALGLATPFLPCGPLYFFFGIALLSGSAERGAELTLAYGMGTLPLLWFAQSQFVRLQAWVSPVWFTRIRVSVALLSAAVAAWRARLGLVNVGTSSNWICF